MRDHSRLTGLCLDVRGLAHDLDPVLLDMVGDVRTGTERAHAQGGAVWAKRCARIASRAGHTSGPIAERRVVARSAEQLGARDAEADEQVVDQRAGAFDAGLVVLVHADPER